MEYTLLEDGTYSVSVGNAYAFRKIVVPAIYKGVAVTEIGCFNDCYAQEIELPDSIVRICDEAFRNCEVEVYAIPASVKYMGEDVFDHSQRIVICCYAQSQPATWNENWCSNLCYVVWGYDGSVIEMPATVLTGECKYENRWSSGTYYGAKVDVSVKNGVIVTVRLWTEEESGYIRTTKSWGTGEGQPHNEGDLGYYGAEAAYLNWINDTFVGKTVEEVLAYRAEATSDGQYVYTDSANLQGATQSAARIICAVQDALKQYSK